MPRSNSRVNPRNYEVGNDAGVDENGTPLTEVDSAGSSAETRADVRARALAATTGYAALEEADEAKHEVGH